MQCGAFAAVLQRQTVRNLADISSVLTVVWQAFCQFLQVKQKNATAGGGRLLAFVYLITVFGHRPYLSMQI